MKLGRDAGNNHVAIAGIEYDQCRPRLVTDEPLLKGNATKTTSPGW
jgi:hypothetical protein